jgi:hypothetical protein
VIWLRASERQTGGSYDLGGVLGEIDGDGGIAHGRLLVEFAEAALGAERRRLDDARDRLLNAAGAEALVDSAAVVALFDAIDRVADATGTPLEEAKAETSVDFREALGVNAFYSAEGKV